MNSKHVTIILALKDINVYALKIIFFLLLFVFYSKLITNFEHLFFQMGHLKTVLEI